MKIKLPYLCSDTDRHGNKRLYVRRNGRKIRIRSSDMGNIGNAEFRRSYDDALAALNAAVHPQPSLPKFVPGTLGWLAHTYFGSSKFDSLDRESQRHRMAIIDECLNEPRKPGSSDLMRDCPLVSLTPQHVLMLRDRKAKEGKPGAANNRHKWLSAMFTWAVQYGHMKSNPARDAERIRYATDGFHTWTIEEVRRYEAHYPVGSKARLALALLLYLGVRRSDVVVLGPRHCKDGWLHFVPRKTRHIRARVSEKPILPELQKIIDASISAGVCGDVTFLVTEYGKPFTVEGFGNWFRARCDEAGLHHCTAHGLRKAGATIAAENGATTPELMALYDWDTASMAALYTRKASKRKLAGRAAERLSHLIVPPGIPEDKSDT